MYSFKKYWFKLLIVAFIVIATLQFATCEDPAGEPKEAGPAEEKGKETKTLTDEQIDADIYAMYLSKR